MLLQYSKGNSSAAIVAAHGRFDSFTVMMIAIAAAAVVAVLRFCRGAACTTTLAVVVLANQRTGGEDHTVHITQCTSLLVIAETLAVCHSCYRSAAHFLLNAA